MVLYGLDCHSPKGNQWPLHVWKLALELVVLEVSTFILRGRRPHRVFIRVVMVRLRQAEVIHGGGMLLHGSLTRGAIKKTWTMVPEMRPRLLHYARNGWLPPHGGHIAHG